jgi:uncharacterized glyoxalase superfamily protein PhnB
VHEGLGTTTTFLLGGLIVALRLVLGPSFLVRAASSLHPSLPRVRELVAKAASGFTIGFTTNDCRKTHQALLARGVEFTQEPVEQPYGIDVGLRDPFGNHIRIVQLKVARA